jgi:hypothetical protein
MRDELDILVNDARPDDCLDVGLDCRTCMHGTAANLAAICKVLDRRGLREAFDQIYQHLACGPMFSIFEQAYGTTLYRRMERPLAIPAAA